MKIVFFSTYPPATCGIGDYTRHLRQAIERQPTDTSIEVVADWDPTVHEEVDSNVVRAWERRGAWNEEAAAAVISRKPRLVHIQHEESLLNQDARFIRFLQDLGKAGIARVVTLHSVYAGSIGLNLRWPPTKFHRAVAANTEAIVVHQKEGGQDTLERQGIPSEKVQVIAHGTVLFDCATRQEARERLNIPATANVVLFFGVIHRKKNLHTVLAAAAQVVEQVPEFRFVVAGRLRNRNPLDALYAKQLSHLMQPARSAGWLDLREGFVSAQSIPDYLAASDLVVFPHHQRYGSASGVFHLALGAGRTTICSSSPKFGEAREIFGRDIPAAIAPTRDVQAWASSMKYLLENSEVRQKAETLARAAAVSTSWDVVARHHLQLYVQVVR